MDLDNETANCTDPGTVDSVSGPQDRSDARSKVADGVATNHEHSLGKCAPTAQHRGVRDQLEYDAEAFMADLEVSNLHRTPHKRPVASS